MIINRVLFMFDSGKFKGRESKPRFHHQINTVQTVAPTVNCVTWQHSFGMFWPHFWRKWRHIIDRYMSRVPFIHQAQLKAYLPFLYLSDHLHFNDMSSKRSKVPWLRQVVLVMFANILKASNYSFLPSLMFSPGRN